tara:strand:+ start:68 stop:292 length:225 start_codon:yes stop_codon:yes gene_type:complete
MASVDNGWAQYQKLVMEKLEMHDGKFSNIDNKLTQIQVDIATLKVKAGVWGGIAGLVPVVLALVLFFATQSTPN